MPVAPKILDSSVIREEANLLGLKILAARNLTPMPEIRESLRVWQENGFAGEMSYMLRPPELFVSPENLLPGARALLSLALEYGAEPHPELLPGFGRIARYAWGGDYHVHFRELLTKLGAAIQRRIGSDLSFRAFTDAVPLLERGFAAEAGLGFIGKNSLLIRPRTGSFFFIGEIVVNFDVDWTPEPTSAGGCGECSRCMDLCPTGAIVGPAIVDARKCVSYLTIEKRGLHTPEERSAIGEWVFGCDVCQDVCPFNHTAKKDSREPAIPEFAKSSGVGPLLDLSEVLGIRTTKEFKKRFEGTPLMRPKREGLLRNAAAAAANTGSHQCSQALASAAREDRSEVVRAQAVWAAKKLIDTASGVDRRLLVDVLDIGKNDASELVRGEAAGD